MVFVCVVVVVVWGWWEGAQGSIQLINTSLHLSDANWRVQSLPSSPLIMPLLPFPLKARLAPPRSQDKNGHDRHSTPHLHSPWGRWDSCAPPQPPVQKTSFHLSLSYTISKPHPLRDTPLRLDLNLRTTSTAFSGPSPLQPVWSVEKTRMKGGGGNGWLRLEWGRQVTVRTTDEGCSRLYLWRRTTKERHLVSSCWTVPHVCKSPL